MEHELPTSNVSHVAVADAVLLLELAPAAPVLLQLSNVFFLFAALFADVLLIRLSLSIAFACLVAHFCVIMAVSGQIVLDGVCWSIFIGAFHWRAVYTLLREELSKGKPLDGDDCALFSFFHRRTGMPRSDFDRLRVIGAWQSFAAGDAICDTLSARSQLHIIVDGKVRVEYRYESASETDEVELGSGDTFDLRVLNICGVFIGFPNESFGATARTPVLCFRMPVDELSAAVRRHAQLLGFLRTFALGQLAATAQRHLPTRSPAHVVRDAFGQLEDGAWCDGGRSRDFMALSPEELEATRTTLERMLRWLRRSFNPWVAPGCRHHSQPFSGSLAQASVQSQSFAGLTDLLDAHRRQRSGYAPIGEADKTVRNTARPQGLNVAVSL